MLKLLGIDVECVHPFYFIRTSWIWLLLLVLFYLSLYRMTNCFSPYNEMVHLAQQSENNAFGYYFHWSIFHYDYGSSVQKKPYFIRRFVFFFQLFVGLFWYFFFLYLLAPILARDSYSLISFVLIRPKQFFMWHFT